MSKSRKKNEAMKNKEKLLKYTKYNLSIKNRK